MNECKYILDGNELTLAPAGWDNVSVNFIRNEFYSSISRNFALSLRFALKAGGGGLEILEAYNTNGINAQMVIVIQVRNPQTNGYETFYNGILDFNPEKLKIDLKNSFIELGIIDGSKELKFFTRDEVEFDIKSDVSADGVTVPDVGGVLDVTFPAVNIYLRSRQIMNYTPNTWDVNNGFTELLDPNQVEMVYNEIGDRIGNTNPIYNNSTPFTTSVRIYAFGYYKIQRENYHILFDRNIIIRFTVAVFDSGGNELDYTRPFFHITWDGTIETSWAAGKVFSVPSGGYINMWLSISTPNVTPNITRWFQLHYLTVNQLDIFETLPGAGEEQIQCIRVQEAMARLIQLTTSETDTAKLLDAPIVNHGQNPIFPNYVDSPHKFLTITSGWDLRKFPDKPFNVSLRKLFKTLDGMLFIGMAYDRVNEVFYLDSKTRFYNEDYLMFDLGSVAELVITPFKQGYYNEIEFGYPDVEFEELQGANEFNSSAHHFLGLNVKQKLNIKGDYNADTIGMEISRRMDFASHPQTDTRYDEQIFLIDCDDDLVSTGVGVTGGFEGAGEYYNTRYTPRENLKRWRKYLNTPLWKESVKSTKFVKTQRNALVVINGQSELTGLSAANLADSPLFLPEVYEFKAPFTYQHIAVLNADPHGIILFNFENVTYGGFLLEVNGNGYNKPATWKVLRATTINKNFQFEDSNDFDYEFDEIKGFE